jgi:5-hydroxyisourate hydrolase
MSLVSTHVLDVSAGRPAQGVAVALLAVTDGAEALLGDGVTDADGRVGSLGPDVLAPGTYRLRFQVGAYFDALDQPSLFPAICVDFLVDESVVHLHLPVLLSPYAYSTYRGS